MTTHTIGIILNGATGRICSTQHVANALAPIRDEGGLPVGDDRIVPRLMLVGRSAERLAAVATSQREASLQKAIAAGKHIYSEKPVALSAAGGAALLREAKARGLKAGAVEDKLYLPGLAKLAKLAASDFFGRVTGFRIEFGWWVFDGTKVP